MLKSSSIQIKYKIITGKDIINLYTVLHEESTRQNERIIDEQGRICGDKDIAKRKVMNITPEFTFKEHDGTTYSGSTLSEIEEFISNRKARITETNLRLHISSKCRINITICTDENVRTYSHYDVIGEDEWSIIIQSKIAEIIRNTNSIPLTGKFLHKYQMLVYILTITFFHLLVGSFYIPIINNYNEGLSLGLSLLQIMIFSIMGLKILDKITYSIEFKLNNEYFDSPSIYRSRVLFAITIGGFIMGILAFL